MTLEVVERAGVWFVQQHTEAVPSQMPAVVLPLMFVLGVLGLLSGFFLGGVIATALTGARPLAPALVLGGTWLLLLPLAALEPGEGAFAESLWALLLFGIVPATLAAFAGASLWRWLRRRHRPEAGLSESGPSEATPEEAERAARTQAIHRMVLAYLVGLALLTFVPDLIDLGQQLLSSAARGLAPQPGSAIALLVPLAVFAFGIGLVVGAVAGRSGALHGFVFGFILWALDAPIWLAPALQAPPTAWPLVWDGAAYPFVEFLSCWAGGAVAAWLVSRKKAQGLREQSSRVAPAPPEGGPE
jgi:hypothetical protein